MEDLFRKFVNAGVGFVSLTTDRVQKTIDALVKESKLSEKEGAKIMDELRKNGETKRKELEKQVQGLATKMMKTVGVAPNSDVEELKRTVKGGSKSSAPAASAKSSAKPAAKPATKVPASKTAAAAKGAVASATSKVASTVKKAADKTGAAASKTQKSAAGSAGAAKKEENKATGAPSSQSNS